MLLIVFTIFLKVALLVAVNKNRSTNLIISLRHQLNLITKYLNDEDPLGMLRFHAPVKSYHDGDGAVQQVKRLWRDFLDNIEGISMINDKINYAISNSLDDYEIHDVIVCVDISNMHYRVTWHYFEEQFEWRIIDVTSANCSKMSNYGDDQAGEDSKEEEDNIASEDDKFMKHPYFDYEL